MMLRPTVWALLLLVPLGLTGCGTRDPAPPPVDKDIGVYVPPPAPPTPAFLPAGGDPMAGDGTPDSGDPLAPGDPLATGEGGGAGAGGAAPAPTIASNSDPLDSTPKMQTDHSHWLHGTISDAQVDVAINGSPLGTFEAPVDKDITMHLREGANTVTFAYTPQGSLAAAHLDILEGEHDTPISPLATFEPPVATDGEASQPVTQTFTFTAR